MPLAGSKPRRTPCQIQDNSSSGLLPHAEDPPEIDHRKEIIPTIVHEVLHDLYESKNEKWIRQVESKISQILKPKDIFLLMKGVF